MHEVMLIFIRAGEERRRYMYLYHIFLWTIVCK